MDLPTLAFGIGLLLAALLISRTWRAVAKESMDRAVGICSTALDQTTRKQANKEKVLGFLKLKDSASNVEIQDILEVSERTVVRYMSELETAGKVVQVGETGRGVRYTLADREES